MPQSCDSGRIRRESTGPSSVADHVAHFGDHFIGIKRLADEPAARRKIEVRQVQCPETRRPSPCRPQASEASFILDNENDGRNARIKHHHRGTRVPHAFDASRLPQSNS